MQEYVVLDTETTGLDAKQHALVEIAAIRYRGGHATETFQTLINPQRSISPGAMATHRITEAMVAQAPTWQDVRGPLLDFIADVPIVAHNATFDRSFIAELHDHTWLCNLRFVRRLWPEAPKHANHALRYWLEIHVDAHSEHRALDDARVTGAIFRRGLQRFAQLGHRLTLESVQAYIQAPISVEAMPYGKGRGKQPKISPQVRME